MTSPMNRHSRPCHASGPRAHPARLALAAPIVALWMLSACGGGNDSAAKDDEATTAAATSETPPVAASAPVSPVDPTVVMNQDAPSEPKPGPMAYFSGPMATADYTLKNTLDKALDVPRPTRQTPAVAQALATDPALRPATSAEPLSSGPATNPTTNPIGNLDEFRARMAATSERTDQWLRQIHLDGTGKLLDGTLAFTRNSISFAPLPRLSDGLKIALAQGSNGRVMAYAFEHPHGQRGRGLVYGDDVLSWMGKGSQQLQHQPMFRQAWNWALPPGARDQGTLRYVNQGHSSATIESYIRGPLGRTPVSVSCNLAAATLASTCASADVFVIGGRISNDPVIRQRLVDNVKSLLEDGKSVMYFAPSTWTNTDAGTQALLWALGEGGPADYPGNFYSCPGACVAVAPGSFAQLRATFNQAADWLELVDMLAGRTAVPDVTTNPKPIQLIEWTHQALRRVQDPAANTPQQASMDLLEPLVNWADHWRPAIVYGASIDKSVDRTAFLRAYASDSWILNTRLSTTIPAHGAGTYTPASAARELVPSTEFEDIDVTIAQASGITLIGRAAVPGKPIEIEVVDPAHSTALAIQTSYLRAWDRPLAFDAKSPNVIRYASPRRPGSWPVPLKSDQRRHFITPFGGPLMLTYNGATPGDVVKLRIRGAARYAHLDFTQPTPVSEAQIAEMTALVDQDALGWMTYKFVNGEVQQKVALSRWIWAKRSMSDYLRHALPDDVIGVNHRTNGFNDVPNSPTVAALCDSFQWDCTSNVHRPPGVQHFAGWIASCGSLCSGQPIDSYTGFSAGWGVAHELGHNTVQRVHTMSFTEPDFDTGKSVTKGCFVECNNNILSIATGLATWARDGTSVGSGRVGTRILYKDVLLPARAEAARRGLSADQARHMMGTRLWTQGSDWARWSLHFQLAALYAKHRHPDSPKVDKDMMFDFLRMLTMGDRLVNTDWSTDKASRYAMGRYTSKTIGNHELIYVLSSKIIGRDLRRVFAMYGVPLSSTALDSVADLGLPVEPLSYYAFPEYAPANGVWLDLEAAEWPAYPFAS